MMLQFCSFATVFFLMQVPLGALGANGELLAPKSNSYATHRCELHALTIGRLYDVVTTSRIIPHHVKSQPDAVAMAPCTLAPLPLSTVSPDSVATPAVFTSHTNSSTSHTFLSPDSARYLTDQADAFAPAFVTAAGIDAGPAESAFFISGNSPALALLALAIISVAAISRRGSGGWAADTSGID